MRVRQPTSDRVIQNYPSYRMALTESQSFLVTMEFNFSGLGLWINRSFKKNQSAQQLSVKQ